MILAITAIETAAVIDTVIQAAAVILTAAVIVRVTETAG